MTKDLVIVCCLEMLLLFLTITCEEKSKQITYPNWKLHYPRGSSMGLFVAAAIPLYLPRNSAYLAFNWEANYLLPENETDFLYPPVIRERVNRKLAYDAVEAKLETQGYPGRTCLLRMICEVSVNSLSESNGVLGDIFHIFLTPSTSKNQGLSNDYQEAEEHGKNIKNCQEYSTKCSVNFLDWISRLENIL